ncbi:MAG: hypothetical protein ACI4TI_00250, partial [Christensenellales bacterium]
LLGDNLEISIEWQGSTTSNRVDRQIYSNFSNISNSCFANYQLSREIIELSLSYDTFSFNTCGAENYFAKLSVSNESEKTLNLKDLSSFVNNNNANGTATFSMTEIIKNVYAENYGSLNGIVKIFVTSAGIVTPFKLNGDVVVFATIDESKPVYLNILNNPTNLVASKLFDLTTDGDLIKNDDIGLNKLYFDCKDTVEMFEFNYTNSANETKTKVLTTNNYLKVYKSKDGVNTYQINTSFLEPDTYSFTIKSLCSAKGQFDQSVNDYVYNYDSFDYVSAQNITKLNTPTEIVCSNGKITIKDDSPNYAENIYILSINDKYIYDDVLPEGKDLNYVLSLISSGDTDSVLRAINLINSFKTKERVLPDSCCGTFEVSVLKVAIPQLPDSALGLLLNYNNIKNGGVAIQANKPNSITVTRLETVKPVLKNGIVEWNAIENAENYAIYKTIAENGKIVPDYDNLIASISAGSELKFDVYNHFSGIAGNYSLTVIANTTKDNYLSSVKSADIKFEILKTPELYVEKGKINWELITNAAGYKLDVYKEGTLFDTLIFNKDVLSFDVMKTSRNLVIESANYEFRITALGEIERNSENVIKDETNIIKSLTTAQNTCTAFKLQTPSVVRVEDGQVVLTLVNSNTGVDYYNLLINQTSTQIDKTKLKFELGANYKAGAYNFIYQAVGGTGCLTSNFSESFDAEKLAKTSQISVRNGELLWNAVNADNYDQGNSDVKYSLSVNKENSIYSEQTTATIFEISKQDLVPSGLYSFVVKVLGDNNYYLNSNAEILNNVVKLGDCKDIRIENGVLTWTNPQATDIVGLPANSKPSPNGYKLVVEQGYDKQEFVLENGTKQFVLDSRFTDGSYNISLQNLGDETNATDYNNTNSKIQSKTIYKLKELSNLNISDGINLKWENTNTKLVQEFIVDIKFITDSGETTYSGVIASTNSSIRFEDICYYENADGERILILSTNGEVTTNEEGNLVYGAYRVYKFDGEGKFEVSVRAFGASKFINSEKSNTISIVRPKEVENLKIENGRVSWSRAEDANGYILTLSRYTLNESGNKVDDEEYNQNYSLVYVNKTYYNLTDVNYYYNVSVRAYSLVLSDEEQTMASKPVSKENYLFNTFTDGNGTEEKPYLITDEQTLINVKFNNVAFYKLANDIVLSSAWTPLFGEDYPFAGDLNGNGNTISGLTISGNFTYSGMLGYIGTDTISDDRVVGGVRTQFIPQDKQTRIGKVHNIDFNNASVTAGIYVAIIAGVSQGEIYNINIRNSQVVSNSEILIDVGASYKSIYSGLVVSVNDGKIEQISVQNDSETTKVEP